MATTYGEGVMNSWPIPVQSVMMSPTLWSAAAAEWRECERVLPYAYAIRDTARQEIASTIGLPLGSVA